MRKAYVKNNQIALYGIMLREVLIMYIIISVSIIVSAYMIYNQMENMSRIYSCVVYIKYAQSGTASGHYFGIFTYAL